MMKLFGYRIMQPSAYKGQISRLRIPIRVFKKNPNYPSKSPDRYTTVGEYGGFRYPPKRK